MFGQRTKAASEGETAPTQETTTQTETQAAASSPRAAETSVAVSAPRASAPAAVAPRRGVIDMSSTRRSPATSPENDRDRTLRVGKGLALAGEITSCDVLVIEGKVEAKLNEGKLLEITETGQFRGSVEIENADIAGRFDGNLVVHGRLTVRATGRISGMVKYGELEVSAGGQIIGEVQVTGANTAAQQPGGHSFKNAARFAALSEDGETEERKERKSA
jgi:cytoskeletal protein CcmA (bactofilin family)